jgi:hypothetical protein
MLERLPVKCWYIRDIQWQIQWNDVSGFDFF